MAQVCAPTGVPISDPTQSIAPMALASSRRAVDPEGASCRAAFVVEVGFRRVSVGCRPGRHRDFASAARKA
jgi:hypothetical protein